MSCFGSKPRNSAKYLTLRVYVDKSWYRSVDDTFDSAVREAARWFRHQFPVFTEYWQLCPLIRKADNLRLQQRQRARPSAVLGVILLDAQWDDGHEHVQHDPRDVFRALYEIPEHNCVIVMRHSPPVIALLQAAARNSVAATRPERLTASCDGSNTLGGRYSLETHFDRKVALVRIVPSQNDTFLPEQRELIEHFWHDRRGTEVVAKELFRPMTRELNKDEPYPVEMTPPRKSIFAADKVPTRFPGGNPRHVILAPPTSSATTTRVADEGCTSKAPNVLLYYFGVGLRDHVVHQLGDVLSSPRLCVSMLDTDKQCNLNAPPSPACLLLVSWHDHGVESDVWVFFHERYRRNGPDGIVVVMISDCEFERCTPTRPEMESFFGGAMRILRFKDELSPSQRGFIAAALHDAVPGSTTATALLDLTEPR